MSIFFYHTTDKISQDPYKNLFLKHGSVFFGIHDREKIFFDGISLNFAAALPSNIKNGGIIEYAETYQKDTEDIYNKIRKDFFDKYCYFLTRFNGVYLGGIFDYLYYFRIHVRAAIRFFDENRIKFIFIAPPSGGFDNIFLQVAEKMGIKYIGLLQSHNKRFFWVKDFNDIGKFSTSLPIFPLEKIQVEKKINTPFYLTRFDNQKKKKNLNSLFKKYIYLLKDFIRPIYYASRILKMLLLHNLNIKINKPVKWLLSGNKSRGLAQTYIQKTSSLLRKNLEKNYSIEKDNSIKILYYLKNQPEATEAYSGSLCDDQLLIIDKLQNISPSNIQIYIKEHPQEEQNDPMARANFWNSISKKNNIFVLPSDLKTSDILNNFDIIATVDGSVGWEAIKNLKPVICFGKPWYLNMPGAFEPNKISNYEEILKVKWTLEDINQTFTNLTQKMGIGYVVHIERKNGYLDSIDEFTNNKALTEEQKKDFFLNNDKRVAESFYKIYSNTC